MEPMILPGDYLPVPNPSTPTFGPAQVCAVGTEVERTYNHNMRVMRAVEEMEEDDGCYL
jgi:hypothetical protein